MFILVSFHVFTGLVRKYLDFELSCKLKMCCCGVGGMFLGASSSVYRLF